MATNIKLNNITDKGVPASRLNDPESVATLVRQLSKGDESRASARAKVKGLVDGNAPYNPYDLKKTGQSYRTNVNFRESESFLGIALSAFYDVFAEVPTYAAIQCRHGDAHEATEYSRILTEEFDRLQKKDNGFDYLMQISQHEMVLYGMGPIMFEDTTDWRCKPVRCGDLLVPDGTKSNIDEWTVAVVRTAYQVHELYAFIRNEEAAGKLGWDIKAARKAIMDAAPDSERRSSHTWEYFQQQIRNNDLSYSARCDTIHCAHVYYREFPTDEHPEGAISHVIVDERGEGEAFLFRRVNRFDNWRQVVHCMYYDKGDGQHHSVKGMGIKMYSAMELKNRLKCSMVDSAILNSSTFLQYDNAADYHTAPLIQAGPVSLLSQNATFIQRNTSGQLDAPLTIERELEGMLQANTSQYRQRLEKKGNPRTATEIEALVAQQSALGKTQLNRYYQQLDALFAERYRRAASKNLTKDMPGGELALEFQRRCLERGVPREALSHTESVTATRSIGQGSPFARRSTLQQLLNIAGMMPETGRESVLRDYVSALVGQSNLERFLPDRGKDYQRQEHEQEAARENPLFKMGATIPVSSSDNHVIHAQTHLAFGAQAAQAVQEGGDPTEVAVTIRTLLPHIAAHLDELGADASRQDIHKMLVEQAQQLAKIGQQINQQVQAMLQQQQQQAAAQQEMQAISGGTDPKEALAIMRAERDEARRDAKNQSDMARKEAKTRQDLALKDAKTAAKL